MGRYIWRSCTATPLIGVQVSSWRLQWQMTGAILTSLKSVTKLLQQSTLPKRNLSPNFNICGLVWRVTEWENSSWFLAMTFAQHQHRLSFCMQTRQGPMANICRQTTAKQQSASRAEAQHLYKNSHVFHPLKSLNFLPYLTHFFHQLPDSAVLLFQKI